MQLTQLPARYRDQQGEKFMRTLGKIAATLSVIGAIAVGSAAPAAAWYGYHRHYGYYHHHYYGYYHHRHYYAYHPYYHHRYLHRHWY
jgi:hypothetical protein